MFDYTLLHWATFFSAVALLELSPGADMAFMLGQTVRNGRMAGFAALTGSVAATFFHIAMAAIGLSAVIATSATAFSMIKWAGVIYLIWLGYQAIFSSKTETTETETRPPKTSSIFMQGALISALNPKVALFFLAFLPQFVVQGAGPVSLQLLLHGVLMVIFGFFLQTPLILMGSRIPSMLKGNTNVQTWFDRCLGAIYVTLGIRLALSKMN
ncbi:lysine transporter LysE [Chromatiales bacterium (ex Bugula neritina AB1)]|nr:lysine transporter LysE [Chromatiales bacterium (ex Bugula neritina AB1)]